MMITIAIGLIGGFISGFLGIGGGIVMVPMLIFLLGFSQKLAQGTTLVAAIPPIGLLAAIAYWKAGNVDIKASIVIAIGFLIGAGLSSVIVQYLPELILKRCFAAVLLAVAIKMW